MPLYMRDYVRVSCRTCRRVDACCFLRIQFHRVIGGGQINSQQAGSSPQLLGDRLYAAGSTHYCQQVCISMSTFSRLRQAVSTFNLTCDLHAPTGPNLCNSAFHTRIQRAQQLR